MSNDVPLLTAEMAALLRGHDPAHIAGCVEALEAIATERAVVVPRMSEAEARERFRVWVNSSKWFQTPQDLMAIAGYLAALRDIGAIRD